MRGRRRTAAAIQLMVLVLCAAPRVEAADGDAERIERLQRQIDELQREVKELKQHQQNEDAAAAAKPAVPPAATASAQAPSSAAAPTAEGALAAIRERVQLGGYGSVRFEANSADAEHTTFYLDRLVLTADAAVAPRLRAYFELEFERFRKLELERSIVTDDGGIGVKQAFEGTGNSEISLEQAWLQYDLFGDPLAVRIGAVLVPLGRFNLNHDDNRWDIARRPLVDRGAPVLPVEAAWDELGVGVNGKAPIGERGMVDYQLYVVNGAVISPEAESVTSSGGGERRQEVASNFSVSTGTFSNDVKDAKAVTGRVAFSPSLGQELAGSFYHGRYTPDFLPSEAINAFGVDGLSIWGPLEFEGEFVQSDFGGVGKVARAFALRSSTPVEGITDLSFALEKLADTRRGYWLEGRYRFRPDWLRTSLFGYNFEDPVLTLVVRGEQVWLEGLLTDIEIGGIGPATLTQVDRRIDRFTIGGSYRPIPLVAFQLAYEYTRVDEGGLGDVTNFLDTNDGHAHAILVGAAFGF